MTSQQINQQKTASDDSSIGVSELQNEIARQTCRIDYTIEKLNLQLGKPKAELPRPSEDQEGDVVVLVCEGLEAVHVIKARGG